MRSTLYITGCRRSFRPLLHQSAFRFSQCWQKPFGKEQKRTCPEINEIYALCPVERVYALERSDCVHSPAYWNSASFRFFRRGNKVVPADQRELVPFHHLLLKETKTKCSINQLEKRTGARNRLQQTTRVAVINVLH